jgi:hypothetical protein
MIEGGRVLAILQVNNNMGEARRELSWEQILKSVAR